MGFPGSVLGGHQVDKAVQECSDLSTGGCAGGRKRRRRRAVGDPDADRPGDGIVGERIGSDIIEGVRFGGCGSPSCPHRKVTNWARVSESNGENVVGVVPVVISFSTIQATVR